MRDWGGLKAAGDSRSPQRKRGRKRNVLPRGPPRLSHPPPFSGNDAEQSSREGRKGRKERPLNVAGRIARGGQERARREEERMEDGGRGNGRRAEGRCGSRWVGLSGGRVMESAAGRTHSRRKRGRERNVLPKVLECAQSSVALSFFHRPADCPPVGLQSIFDMHSDEQKAAGDSRSPKRKRGREGNVFAKPGECVRLAVRNR